MTPRPRPLGIKRVIPTMFVVTIAALASMTLGPILASERVPAPPTRTGPPGPVVRDEPSTVHVPAPVLSIPNISSIANAPPVGGPSLTSATRDALRRRLDGILAKYDIPGISVAISFPDGATWVGTTGLADVAAGVPVTRDTAFAVASVTKTFTGALIMSLVEDGRIDLDASVVGYVPEVRIDPKITVRQLLDHTSGLRDYFSHPLIDPVLVEHPTRRWNEVEALRYTGKPYFKPGTGWHYSNTNYLILGMVAEAVVGVPLGEQLRTRFIEPLGLSDTFYQPTEAPVAPVAKGYRFAAGADGGDPIDLSDGTPTVPFTSVVTAAAGAGGLASSASDMARWVRALYAGSALSSTSVQEMLDDAARTEPYRPTIPYGLGVQIVEVGGHTTLGHSGRLLGFRSAVRWLPNERVAIAVLTNQSRTDPGIIARALLKIALKPAVGCVCADRR